MSTAQKILLGCAGLLLCMCTGLGGLGLVWWLTSGQATVAALESTATLTPTPSPSATPTRTMPATSATQATPPRASPSSPASGGTRSGASFGVVQKVETNSITLAEGQQTQVINVTARTQVIYAGKPAAALKDIQVGDRLLAIGPVTRDGRTDARAVLVVPASYRPESILVGQVKSASNKALVVTTFEGSRTVERTVALDSETQVYDQGLNPENATDLPAGLPVIVIGQTSGFGFKAEVILTGSRPGRSGTPAPAPPSGTPRPSPTPRRN